MESHRFPIILLSTCHGRTNRRCRNPYMVCTEEWSHEFRQSGLGMAKQRFRSLCLGTFNFYPIEKFYIDSLSQFRQLQSLLAAYSSDSSIASPARVLWMSSMEAHPCFEEEDWQLIKTSQSYQGSKYQMDILCAELSRRTRDDDVNFSPSCAQPHTTSSSGKIMHILISPGIRITELATEVHKVVPLGLFWIWLLFSLVRVFHYFTLPHN